MAKAKKEQAPTLGPLTAPERVAAPERIKVRVLATGAFGQIDSVVELTPAEVAQGVGAGQVDPHPDAVAYAASLKEK